VEHLLFFTFSFKITVLFTRYSNAHNDTDNTGDVVHNERVHSVEVVCLKFSLKKVVCLASKSLERSQGIKKNEKRAIYFASTAHFAFPLFYTVSIDSLFPVLEKIL
jgi:hypothetical protein